MLLLPDAGAVHVNEAGMVDLEIGNKKLTHSISISHKNLEVFDYHNDVFGVDLMNAFGLFADYEVVVDYSQINRFIEPAEISTTDLKEHLLYFPGAIFFSLIFIDKYHKLPIREGDRKITAFKTWRGLFQFRKLPYGLNANTIRYRHLNFYPTPCIQYTDSILICTRNINCHQIELKQVLECLINNGFTIDCQKSQFFRRKIIFKDFLFTWNGWHITPENKKIIDNFPIPKSKIETQFFLELVEKNKDFIPDLSSLTASLYKHIKSAQFPDWTEEVDEDFHKIKKSIKMARALHYPNDKVTFFLTPYVGAVQSVLIATLTQQRTPQIVVGYFSRPMKNEEEDFQGIQFVDHVVFERTMLAALAAMDYFSVYTKRFYLRLSKAAQVYLKKPVNEKFWKEKWKKYDFTIVPTVSD
ncbi:hypothetical protein SNEBB_010904 [Seison nebaliae]|nr:hypothetical protein SNEBB_010904 [Seison nebaliae]